MGTSIGVGYSTRRNPAEAGKEAALKALDQARIEKPDFVFVFASVGYNQEVLIRGIRQATAHAPLSGCSGEGIIAQGIADETNFGVAVMVIRSDDLQFHAVHVNELTSGSAQAGKRLAEVVKPHIASDCMAGFLFADGLALNFDPFLTAFEQALRSEHTLPIFGGLAADNWTSQKTYQYYNNDVFSNGISFVLMSGQGGVAWGINHGCVPVGTKRTITRCKGNEIFEIDGLPALDVLKEYSGEDMIAQWNKITLNLCLGFKTPEHLRHHYEEYLIRYMNRKNDQLGSVSIQSDVREGTDLWLARRDKELIRSGMQSIADQIRKQAGTKKLKFVMHFECMGRGKVVFRESEKRDLIKFLQKKTGEDIPWIGFYGYGEIGPIREHNCFHNFTAVVAAVY